MPRRREDSEYEYDRLPKYLKLNDTEREQLLTLHRYGHDVGGKVEAYNYLFPDKVDTVENISKIKWWSMRFGAKQKARDLFIDKIVASELKDLNVSRDNITTKVLELAIKSERKGDLKGSLEAYKFVARLQGYIRDRQINIAQFMPAIEIHHEPLAALPQEQTQITISPAPTQQNVYDFFNNNLKKDDRDE